MAHTTLDDRIFKFTHYKSYNDFPFGLFPITNIEKALSLLEKKYSNNFKYLISYNDLYGVNLYIKINTIIYFHKFHYDMGKYELIELNCSEYYIKKNKNIIYKVSNKGYIIFKYKNNKLISVKTYGKTLYGKSIYRLYSIYRKNFKHIKINYKDYRLNYIEYDKNGMYKFSHRIRFDYDYNRYNIYITKEFIIKFSLTHLIINNYRYIFLFI